jgi:sugar/nucleoside kinase (ribokinase family)
VIRVRTLSGINERDQLEKSIRFFTFNGAKNVIVTMEGKGCIALLAGRRMKYSAFPVKSINSTGSGDAFEALFIKSILNNEDYESAIRLASAAGALVAEKGGGRLSMPSSKEIEKFMSTNGSYVL